MIIIITLVRRLLSIARDLSLILLILLIVFITGVLGFHYLENLNIPDAIYFTIVTMATIGYGDIAPRTFYGKLLVVFIALFGISSFAVAITSVIQRLSTERINKLFGFINGVAFKDHVIVCGWSETSKSAINELLASSNKDIVLIDDKTPRAPLSHPRVEFIYGDPRDPEVLRKAGIKQASHMIVALEDDSATLITILQAKSLNRNIIIASESRAGGSLHNVLKQAGANEVIDSLSFIGRILATTVSKPGVAQLFDDLSVSGTGVDIAELPASRRIIGKRFEEVICMLKRENNLMPIAVRRGRKLYPNPSLDEVINEGDIIIVIGDSEVIAKLIGSK